MAPPRYLLVAAMLDVQWQMRDERQPLVNVRDQAGQRTRPRHRERKRWILGVELRRHVHGGDLEKSNARLSPSHVLPRCVEDNAYRQAILNGDTRFSFRRPRGAEAAR